MKLTIPPPNWLRSFEAAGRLGSFTEAAAELGVTPSAVSQQVRLLEQHLGAQLFRRLPKGLELTDHGKSFLQAVQGGFGSIKQAAAELFESSGPNLVVLRVNASFAYRWLANRLPDFQAANPSISLRMYLTHWPTETDWEGLSLEIRYGDGRWPGFRSERLTEEEFFPVCAPEICNQSPRLESPSAGGRVSVPQTEARWRDPGDRVSSAQCRRVKRSPGPPVFPQYRVLLTRTAL